MIVTRKSQTDLGDLLCEQRQRRGLTQRRLADRMNYNNAGISKIETAAAWPRLDVLIGLCEQLGLEIEIRETRA